MSGCPCSSHAHFQHLGQRETPPVEQAVCSLLSCARFLLTPDGGTEKDSSIHDAVRGATRQRDGERGREAS